MKRLSLLFLLLAPVLAMGQGLSTYRTPKQSQDPAIWMVTRWSDAGTHVKVQYHSLASIVANTRQEADLKMEPADVVRRKLHEDSVRYPGGYLRFQYFTQVGAPRELGNLTIVVQRPNRAELVRYSPRAAEHITEIPLPEPPAFDTRIFVVDVDRNQRHDFLLRPGKR